MISPALIRVGFNPEEPVFRLAQLVSLALRAEPTLVRRARLDLLGEPDPALEADLWFHPAVQHASADGLVFEAEVGEELRRHLAFCSEERYERAWELVAEHHVDLSPALRLEEEVLYLAHSRRPEARARTRQLLQSALAALVSADRRGLAQWAARALPRFPREVRELDEAAMLHAAADLRLGDRLVAGDARLAPEDWMSWVAPAARAEIGVTLQAGAHGDIVSFEEAHSPGSATHTIPVLATDPLVLDVLAGDEPEDLLARVEIGPGEAKRMPFASSSMRLRTLLGEEFRLEVEKRAWERETLDFSGVFARHDPVYETEYEQNVSVQLANYSAEESGGYVPILGPNGGGKTALLTYLARAFAPLGAELAPHHFFRREIQEWMDPARVERSLIAQVERLLPKRSLEPSRSFRGALERWSETRGEQELLIVLDGLDWLDDPEVLESLRPKELPPGVKIAGSVRSDPRKKSWVTGRVLGTLETPPPRPELLALWREAKGFQSYQIETLATGDWWSLEILRSTWESLPGGTAPVEPEGKPGLAQVLHEVVLRQADEVLQRFWAIVCMAREAVPADLLRDVLPLEGGEILAERHTVDGEEVWIPRSEEIAELVPVQLPAKRYIQYQRHFLDLLRQQLGKRNEHDFVSDRADRFVIAHVLHQALGSENWETIKEVIGSDALLVRFLKNFGVNRLLREFEPDRKKKLLKFRILLMRHKGRLNGNPEALPALIDNRFREEELPPWDARGTLALGLSQVHRRRSEPDEPRGLAHYGPVLGVRYVGFPSRLVSWGADDRVLMHRKFKSTNREFLRLDGEIVGCAIHLGKPFGALAVATRDGSLVITDVDHPERSTTHRLSQIRGLAPIWPRGFATYSDDELRLWNDHGEPLRVLETSGSPVTSACSLSDSRIAAGCADGTLFAWSQETGEELARREGHTAPVTFLAPGATHLASAGEDATIRLWDLENLKDGLEFVGHQLAVTRLGFAAGDRVVSSSMDGTARVWSTETGEELAVLEHSSPVTGMLFRTDELITTAVDGVIRRWPRYESRIGSTIDAHTLPCRGCAAGHNNSILATWDDGGAIRIWALNSETPDEPISEIAWQNPRPRPLIPGTRRWIAFESNRVFEAHLDRKKANEVGALEIRPDGIIASGKDPNDLRILAWNSESFEITGTTDAQPDPSTGTPRLEPPTFPESDEYGPLDCDLFDDFLVYVLEDSINAFVQGVLLSYAGQRSRKNTGCYALNRNRALTWARDGNLYLTKFTPFQSPRNSSLEGHRGPILACTVNRNRTEALSASTDASVRHWDLQTGTLLQVWEEIDPHITALHLDVSQHVLLAGTFQGDVFLLSRTQGFTTRAPAHAKHDDRVRAFEPYPGSAGRRFYSISDDGTIKLWEIVEDRHGRHLLCLETAYADDALLSVSAIDNSVAAQDARHDLWIYRYEPPEDPRLRWASRTVSLHERPDLDSRVVMTLEPTTALEVLERRSDWLQIRPLGRSTKAWVRDEDLDPVSSAP